VLVLGSLNTSQSRPDCWQVVDTCVECSRGCFWVCSVACVAEERAGFTGWHSLSCVVCACSMQAGLYRHLFVRVHTAAVRAAAELGHTRYLLTCACLTL
jgi:hypothetical protein